MFTPLPDTFSQQKPAFQQIYVESHAGELIQGPWRYGDGSAGKVLVTLRTRSLMTTHLITEEHPSRDTPSLMPKTLFLRNSLNKLYGIKNRDLHIERVSNIPVGKGLGSSTSDLLSFAKNYLAYHDIYPEENDIFRIATESERYSDPLYSTRNFLFNSGDKTELVKYPSLGIIGCALIVFSKCIESIDTDSLSSDYSTDYIMKFSTVLALTEAAFSAGNSRLLMRAAMASARLNQDRIKLWDLEELWAKAQKLSLGFSVSHSGTAMVFHMPDFESLYKVKHLMESAGYDGIEIKTYF